MAKEHRQDNTLAAAGFAVFAVVCLVAFFVYRGADVGKLGRLIDNLGGGDLVGDPIPALPAIVVAGLIFVSWTGLGRQVLAFLPDASFSESSGFLDFAMSGAVGAAIWSLVWCIAGFFGGYVTGVVIACTAAGVIMATIPTGASMFRGMQWWKERTIAEWLLMLLIAIPLLLAAIAAIAPPTAKDTLLYHFAVPKDFIAQHGNAVIDGNIASYLALGAEMHVVWAMLLGGLFSPVAAEAGAGLTSFLFFPLLIAAVYGWSRELGSSRVWALIATTIVATVPTAFHVASSAYIDLALALFVVLATYSLTKWWASGETRWVIVIAILLGAALSIKLTTVFVIAAFALIVALKACGAKNDSMASGKILAAGFAALLLAGVIASPWYARAWVATGSPVFPFYMNIWPGKANGWDVERSKLFQQMNAAYGNVDDNKLNLITAPVRASIMAQPEYEAYYDGVIGVAFLIGLPVLIWGLWKFDLPVAVKICTGVAGIYYFCWLFSSEQLRYLLPILPLLAIGIAVAAEAIAAKGTVLRSVWKCSLIAAAVAGILTSFAWFCQRAPLRAAFGGEKRNDYLARNLDYYPYYQEINFSTMPDARVWLINMRRDTYDLERPVVSDYLFEDWTLRKMLWETRSVEELRAKAAAMNVQYVLARHDFLFDYDRSSLVDDQRPRAENEAKLQIAKAFLLDPNRTVKADDKFSLIKVF